VDEGGAILLRADAAVHPIGVFQSFPDDACRKFPGNFPV
jgi:hypothetical protein